MKDLKTVLQLAIGFLQKHKITKARLYAELLLAHILKMKRIELYMHFDRLLLEEELEKYRAVLKRARGYEPLEYILGEMEFYHTTLKVTPAVLIPRQETEILLDTIVKSLDGSEKIVLDLCTGSGCLAIGLKKARPGFQVTAVDLSEEALAVARENGLKNGVEIEWLHGDLTEPVKGRKFDLILCNPPYVTDQEYLSLEKSVRDFEPKMALTSGPTGYEFYDRLNHELPQILNPSARVYFEMGTGQGHALIQRFSKRSWQEIRLEKDWAGHDRFLFIK